MEAEQRTNLNLPDGLSILNAELLGVGAALHVERVLRLLGHSGRHVDEKEFHLQERQ